MVAYVLIGCKGRILSWCGTAYQQRPGSPDAPQVVHIPDGLRRRDRLAGIES